MALQIATFGNRQGETREEQTSSSTLLSPRACGRCGTVIIDRGLWVMALIYLEAQAAG